MRHSSKIAAVLLLAAAACGHIDIKSVRSGNVVPANLEGEWFGQWQSTASPAAAPTGGPITMHLQQWQGQAVVSIGIDNPCIVPRDYEFALRGATLELLADGQPLFTGVVEADRQLTGSYSCALDTGTWQATWQRVLPPVLDVTGDWEGSLMVVGAPAQVMNLRLDQFVQGGALGVAGAMQLPGLLVDPVQLRGSVRFGEGAFELLLGTTPDVTPAAVMVGTGQAEPLEGLGSLQVAPDPRLPFGQAVWTAVWRQR